MDYWALASFVINCKIETAVIICYTKYVNTLAQIDIADHFDTPFGQSLGVKDLVSIILSNAVVIAGTILLFLLVFGGISIIVGAGQSDPETTAKGKKAATSAVIGFAIIFTVYWIAQLIEAITRIDFL